MRADIGHSSLRAGFWTILAALSAAARCWHLTANWGYANGFRATGAWASVARRTFSFALNGGNGDIAPVTVAVDNLIIAGWTGRDPKAVEQHIRELEALGVKRPAAVPIFYRVAVARLTTASAIEVLGEKSSGEVEFVLLKCNGRLWVGTGSDHTDREAEVAGVSLSK